MRRLVVVLAAVASCSDHEAAERYAAAYCADYCSHGESSSRCSTCGAGGGTAGGAAGGAAGGFGGGGGGAAGGSAGGTGDGGFTLEVELQIDGGAFARECIPVWLAAPGASADVYVRPQPPAALSRTLADCDSGLLTPVVVVPPQGRQFFLMFSVVGQVTARLEAEDFPSVFVERTFASFGQTQLTLVTDGGDCIDVPSLRATAARSDGRDVLADVGLDAQLVTVDDGGQSVFEDLGCTGTRSSHPPAGHAFSFERTANDFVTIGGPYLVAAHVRTRGLMAARVTGDPCTRGAECLSDLCAMSTRRCLCTPTGGTCIDGPSQCCNGLPCVGGLCQ